MLNKILYFVSFYFCVLVIPSVFPDTFTLANEGIQVSVDGQNVDTKNFFSTSDCLRLSAFSDCVSCDCNYLTHLI